MDLIYIHFQLSNLTSSYWILDHISLFFRQTLKRNYFLSFVLGMPITPIKKNLILFKNLSLNFKILISRPKLQDMSSLIVNQIVRAVFETKKKYFNCFCQVLNNGKICMDRFIGGAVLNQTSWCFQKDARKQLEQNLGKRLGMR